MGEQQPKMSAIQGKIRPTTDGSPLPALSFTHITPELRQAADPDELKEWLHTWAPPTAADNWYSLSIDEKPDSGRPSIHASLTLPPASWQLGEARVTRIGGRSQDDAVFQTWLYAHIGAAAVNGGRIEAAMKRLILSLSGALEPAFADAEAQWSTLEKKLRTAAEEHGENAADIIEALNWGQENRIREIRNDIIHAYWWDYANVGITRGRVHRDGTSELILITPAQLLDDCRKLEMFADALDSAMDDRWLNIYLPRTT